MADVWVPGWEIRRFTDPKSFLSCSNMVACAHTQVGGYPGSWEWGNRDGNPYAQSYLEGNGHGINAWPVNLRGAANLEGNGYCWAIETEDVDPKYFPAWSLRCGDVPTWTDAQEQALTEAFAWWCIRFKRPPVMIPDAKPDRIGLGYHRFGVPNSPEWVTGADRWTRSEGKCCPDWRRIAQFKQEIVPGVAAIVNGIKPPVPVREDDEMFAYDFGAITNKVLVIVSGGKQTRVIGATVGATVRGGDYYIGHVDDQMAGWLKKNYGAVVGL